MSIKARRKESVTAFSFHPNAKQQKLIKPKHNVCEPLNQIIVTLDGVTVADEGLVQRQIWGGGDPAIRRGRIVEVQGRANVELQVDARRLHHAGRGAS